MKNIIESRSLKNAPRSSRVIHIPSYQDPYQRSLVSNLLRLGFDVRYGSIKQYFSVIEGSLFYNLIKHFEVGIIHLHWQHPFLLGKSKWATIVKSLMFIMQIVCIKMVGVRLVWTVHNIKNHENLHKELELFFTSKIARFANKIIVHCNTSKTEIIRLFNVPECKIAVIPHGNFIDTFENKVSRGDARTRLSLLSTDFIFLSLGLIRPYKGIMELIESFRTLKIDSIKLIIVGEAHDRQFERAIQDKVIGVPNVQLVLQFIRDDEIQLYMNAADVIVLAYRDILNSGGIFAAMSFGKPIIAPSIGCIPEVLNSSGSFLYEPSEQDGLSDAMRRAIASKKKLQEMGIYNFNLAKEFNWRDIALSTSEIYEKCLAGC